MRIVKTTLLGSVLVGIAALFSQSWADDLTTSPNTVRSMNQEQMRSQQRQTPTAADFERLNNRNRNESRSMNRQPQGNGTGTQYQNEHQHRYGSVGTNPGSHGGHGR